MKNILIVSAIILGGVIIIFMNTSQTNEPRNTTPETIEPVTQWNAAPEMEIDPAKEYIAVIETTKGTMRAKLFTSETPITVNNFIFLARNDFYDNTPFHRIIKGFMIQGGDGQYGNGTGGPGYRFNDEPVTRDYARGTLAMANAGPNTNGSQFFIMHADYPLPKQYVIFGELVQGFDALDAIADTSVGPNGSGENSRPLEEVLVTDVRIEEE